MLNKNQEKLLKFSSKYQLYSGLVDTYFHTREEGDPYRAKYLTSQNMANAITYILEAPKHVVIDELMIHQMRYDV